MGSQNHPPEVLVQVRQLCKGFNASGSRLEILNGIDVDLKPAETMAVVGASGIGKSTLLHILGTLDRPDSGQVLFQGDDVFRYDDARLARFRNRSIGFVFQFHHLLPEFSAKENVMMPALIQGLERHAAEDAAVNILMRVFQCQSRVTRLWTAERLTLIWDLEMYWICLNSRRLDVLKAGKTITMTKVLVSDLLSMPCIWILKRTPRQAEGM